MLSRSSLGCGATIRLAAAAVLLASVAGCGNDPRTPTGPSPGDPPGGGATGVLVGAGDIAVCGVPGAEATAHQLDGIQGTVFTAGDNAYYQGSEEQYRTCYDPTWGRHRGRTRPTPGNHEYESPFASPYFAYFGASAGPAGVGYYRYTVAAWQIYSLNSNVPIGSRSAQLQWLGQELAANPSSCSAAIWHHPYVSSGPNGSDPMFAGLWRVLYDAGVDVIINGHDHLYERFEPQDPTLRLDFARGIRQFTVGTGGAPLYEFVNVQRNSSARISTWGVLRLTLQPRSYVWDFLAADTGMAQDSGSDLCH